MSKSAYLCLFYTLSRNSFSCISRIIIDKATVGHFGGFNRGFVVSSPI